MNTSKFLLSIAGMGFGIGGAVLGSIPLAGLGLGVATTGVLSGISGKNLDFIFKRCKLEIKEEEVPRLISYCRNDIGDQYTYSIPTGMSIADFKKKEQEISQALCRDIEIKLVNNKLVIQTIDKQLREKYNLDLSNFSCYDMKFKVGKDRSEQEVLLDLSDSLHTLICGATGSGKSVCLNVLITSFILANLELSLIDLKGGVEMVIYKHYKNLRGMAVVEEQAEQLLKDTVDEMNRRYKLLFQYEKKGFKDYNKSFPNNKMKQRILIVDEYSALMDNKVCQKYLFDLMARARACGISVIIATQSPRHEILPGRIRDNLAYYLIFRCSTPTASEVATGVKGNDKATKLKGAGHGLLRSGDTDFKEFQGYYLSDQEIKQYIKPYCIANKPIEEQQESHKDNIIQLQNKRPTEPNKAQEYRQQDNKGSSTLRDLDAILSRIDAL